MLGLHLDNVSYSYADSNFSLRDVNILGVIGEVICLLGPSGCGKSTVLKLIAGLEKLNSGTIIVNSKIVASDSISIPVEKRNVSLIFQHPSLFTHKTVIENVMFPMRNIPRSERYESAIEILESVDMVSYEKHYPHMLSGGQQQLVTIARSMAQKPDIVLLDEPFSSLDKLLKIKIRDRILSLLKNKGITVLLVTHDPEEALEIADTIYVMRNGNIIQYGTPYDIYYYPKDFILAELFCSVNNIRSIVRDGSVELSLGEIPALGLKEGDEVMACVRPEAIILQDNGVKSFVRDVSLFKSIVRISVENYIYSMKFPNFLLPKVGETISIGLDFSKVLLFKI